jgi:hypothetical protein
MSFTASEWTIPTVLTWIATRDRSEVDRLDYKTTRSLVATAALVPAARSALPEFIARAAEGAISVMGVSADGKYEQVDKLVFTRAAIQEDEHGLFAVSHNVEGTATSWTSLHVRRESALALWPSSLPVWPIFKGTAALRDFAATVEPTKINRWAELSALIATPGHVHADKHYERYVLKLQIEGSVETALSSGQFHILSNAAVLDRGDWEGSYLHWDEDVVERLETARVDGKVLPRDQWGVVEKWDGVTVCCTDAALLACPAEALTELNQCPRFAVRPPFPVISKRLFSFQVVLTKTGTLVVVPHWLPMRNLLADLIGWCIRKLYWPSS